MAELRPIQDYLRKIRPWAGNWKQVAIVSTETAFLGRFLFCRCSCMAKVKNGLKRAYLNFHFRHKIRYKQLLSYCFSIGLELLLICYEIF